MSTLAATAWRFCTSTIAARSNGGSAFGCKWPRSAVGTSDKPLSTAWQSISASMHVCVSALAVGYNSAHGLDTLVVPRAFPPTRGRYAYLLPDRPTIFQALAAQPALLHASLCGRA